MALGSERRCDGANSVGCLLFFFGMPWATQGLGKNSGAKPAQAECCLPFWHFEVQNERKHRLREELALRRGSNSEKGVIQSRVAQRRSSSEAALTRSGLEKSWLRED